MNDIEIYRGSYDSELNYFYGRREIGREEVVLKTKSLLRLDGLTSGAYTYAEPYEPGSYAFGGTILFTSNGIFPEFNTPVKLHDRRVKLER